MNLLFANILYPEFEKASKIYVAAADATVLKANEPYICVESKKYDNDLRLDILSHPHIRELIEAEEESGREELKKTIVYQTFALLCQRFSGKMFDGHKLVSVDNDLFSLDAVLYTLQKKKEND